MDTKEFIVSEKDKGVRMDQFLARQLVQHFSRSQVQKWIAAGGVEVEGVRVTSSHYRLKSGERIQVAWPERGEEGTRAEAIPIDVIYEDEDLVVVNKPAGMVVHPAHGHPSHTLVNALLYHVRSLSKVGGEARPGIVHRLDKDTSGLLVVAKSDEAHADLSRQFKAHQIDRVYDVFVRGVVRYEEGEIDQPVGRAFLNRKKVVVRPSGGKPAVTYYRVKQRFPKATWLEVKPRTGRTHQIRVHLAHLGYPALGDALYGVRSVAIDRQALHASQLGFTHPRTGKKVHFTSPLPGDLEALCGQLESSSKI